MNPRDPKIDQLIERIRPLMRARAADEWAADVVNALEPWDLGVEVLAALMARLQSENATLPGSLWTAREIVSPQLHAKLSIEENKSAESFGKSATRLARAAVIFGAIQAFCAAVSLYMLFRGTYE